MRRVGLRAAWPRLRSCSGSVVWRSSASPSARRGPDCTRDPSVLCLGQLAALNGDEGEVKLF